MVGTLYKVTQQELRDILKTPDNTFELPFDSIDLSYFALEYLEIISTYSGLEQNNVGEILQGMHPVEVQDGYLGYSQEDEVSEIKSKTLDRITENDLVDYLNRAEQENHLLGSYYSSKSGNREFLIEYFNNVKRIYQEATLEGKCLLYRIA